jgi:hypothetical protein
MWDGAKVNGGFFQTKFSSKKIKTNRNSSKEMVLIRLRNFNLETFIKISNCFRLFMKRLINKIKMVYPVLHQLNNLIYFSIQKY